MSSLAIYSVCPERQDFEAKPCAPEHPRSQSLCQLEFSGNRDGSLGLALLFINNFTLFLSDTYVITEASIFYFNSHIMFILLISWISHYFCLFFSCFNIVTSVCYHGINSVALFYNTALTVVPKLFSKWFHLQSRANLYYLLMSMFNFCCKVEEIET